MWLPVIYYTPALRSILCYRYVRPSITLVCQFNKRLNQFFFKIGTHTNHGDNYYVWKGNFTGIIIMEVMATPHMGVIEDSGSKFENL